MDRQFGFPFFNPFFSPFLFPQRQFFPFFFLSPFFFPFFRGEEDREGTYCFQHQCTEGDTMGLLAQRYNVPQPILEAMNQQYQDPNVLSPGSTAYIPRMDKMYCHKMYLEQGAAGTENTTQLPTQQAGLSYPTYPGKQAVSPYSGANYPSYPGKQAVSPYSGANYPAYPAQQAVSPYSGANYPAYPAQQAVSPFSGKNYPAQPAQQAVSPASTKQQTTPMYSREGVKAAEI